MKENVIVSECSVVAYQIMRIYFLNLILRPWLSEGYVLLLNFFCNPDSYVEMVQRRPVKSISVVGSKVSHEKLTQAFHLSLP